MHLFRWSRWECRSATAPGCSGARSNSIVAQDYPNLEIVVSDNASTDATADILAEYAKRYPIIRIVRQDKTLTAIDNFLFVMREARGEFFAWCAHDDTRSPDFVSGLLPAFEDPGTVLAFGDLCIWDGQATPVKQPKYDFANDGLPRWRRLRKAALMQCYHVYGLWRTSALRAVDYHYTHWWSDMPLVLGAAAIGNFRYMAGPQFYYFEIPKSAELRAGYQDNRKATSRLANFSALFRATFMTVSSTAGPVAGMASDIFLAEKYASEACHRVLRRIRAFR